MNEPLLFWQWSKSENGNTQGLIFVSGTFDEGEDSIHEIGLVLG